MSVLEVSNLSKVFGEVPALSRISFKIDSGENVLLVGPNGAGKSTLLNCLAGVYRPDQGTIVRPEKMTLGFLSQPTFLYGDMSVAENLRLYAVLYDVSSPETAVAEILSKLGMERHAHKRIRECSQGMMRRAALCRALLHRPSVLLLDEPFANLDPDAKEKIIELLRGAAGTTIVLATNEVEVIDAHRGRLLVLRDGALVSDVDRSDVSPREMREWY